MKLFSVVLTNYNQENYIYEAIDSVLMQEYGRIQLIITDDASTNFNKKIIEDYINEKCGLNIESIDFITNKKNVGTVKTLNDALKIVKGDYVLFFAADDALFDPSVLSTFVKEFDINKDINALTSQAYMCGEELLLNVESRKFVKEEEMSTFNNYDSNEQFYYIANECPFVSGATAYRTNLFKKTNGFDVDFKLVEDWSFWLMITSIGEIIKYIKGGGIANDT